ncbi:hypothetical protein JW824_14315 [bacterium]|nr:hypothetical protein [bacterium]
MKITNRYGSPLYIAVLVFCIMASHGFAQMEDAIEQLNSDNTKGYLQPFIDAFGSDLNAGIYRTARLPGMGIHLYVGVIAMGAMIPDEGRTYMGTPSTPYPQTQVETATVFGDEGAIVDFPNGLSYAFQDGQISGDFVPLAVPHIEIGSILGTILRFRYTPPYDIKDVGELKFLGYGLQHSISQYIPLMPVDISVGFFKQDLDIGDDFLALDALSYGIQVSKSFPVLTLYGALAMESTSMNVSYTFKGEGVEEEISLEMDTDNQFRMTVGAQLKLAILILHGDFSLSKYNTASVGIGLGL